MAHPGDAGLGQTLEERADSIEERLGLAVLPGGVVLGLGDFAAQSVGDELAAVANAQNGHAPGKDLGIHMGGLLQIDGVGAAGEDDADGVHGLQLAEGRGKRLDFAIDIAFTDAAGDQLVILAAEIQNNDQFMCHGGIPSSLFEMPNAERPWKVKNRSAFDV